MFKVWKVGVLKSANSGAWAAAVFGVLLQGKTGEKSDFTIGEDNNTNHFGKLGILKNNEKTR